MTSQLGLQIASGQLSRLDSKWTRCADDTYFFVFGSIGEWTYEIILKELPNQVFEISSYAGNDCLFSSCFSNFSGFKKAYFSAFQELQTRFLEDLFESGS